MTEPRMDKVEEARWRIRTGYYDLPDVMEELVDRLVDRLSEEKPD